MITIKFIDNVQYKFSYDIGMKIPYINRLIKDTDYISIPHTSKSFIHIYNYYTFSLCIKDDILCDSLIKQCKFFEVNDYLDSVIKNTSIKYLYETKYIDKYEAMILFLEKHNLLNHPLFKDIDDLLNSKIFLKNDMRYFTRSSLSLFTPYENISFVKLMYENDENMIEYLFNDFKIITPEFMYKNVIKKFNNKSEKVMLIAPRRSFFDAIMTVPEIIKINIMTILMELYFKVYDMNNYELSNKIFSIISLDINYLHSPNKRVSRDNSKYTFLMIAIMYDMKEVVDMLLKIPNLGLNINKKNNKGHTALMIAVTYKNKEKIIKSLLDYKDIDVNLQDDNGTNIIFINWLHGSESYFDILSDYVDINQKTESGYTFLTYICSNMKVKDDLTILKKILNHPDIDVNVKDANLRTPLIHNTMRNDINYRYGNREKVSYPSHKLSLKYEALKILLERDDIDVNVRDCLGMSPLEYATGYSEECVIWYVKYSESDKLINRNCVELLLSHSKIDVGNIDIYGNTILHRMINKCWNLDIYKLFIDHSKININVQNSNGNTFLILLIMCMSRNNRKYINEKEFYHRLLYLLLGNPDIDVDICNNNNINAYDKSIIVNTDCADQYYQSITRLSKDALKHGCLMCFIKSLGVVTCWHFCCYGCRCCGYESDNLSSMKCCYDCF
jgi:ankyrin repeat protein